MWLLRLDTGRNTNNFFEEKRCKFSLVADIIKIKIDMMAILRFKNNYMYSLAFTFGSNSFLTFVQKNKSSISLLLKPTNDKKWWQTKKTFLNLTLLKDLHQIKWDTSITPKLPAVKPHCTTKWDFLTFHGRLLEIKKCFERCRVG